MISQSEVSIHSIDWLSQSEDSIDLVVGDNVDGALGAVVGQLGHAHGLVHHTLERQTLMFDKHQDSLIPHLASEGGVTVEDHTHGLLTLGISSVELLSTHLQPITAQHGNISTNHSLAWKHGQS